VKDKKDSTVRGVVTFESGTNGMKEVTTTERTVVMLQCSQLAPTKLTAEEAARCSRPAEGKDYMQARVDGVIRVNHGGHEFKNRYTCADGTERRQVKVTSAQVRCDLCDEVLCSYSHNLANGDLMTQVRIT